MFETISSNWVMALIIFAVLQVADIWTTRQGLARGAREGNPVVAWCMQHLGRYGWIMVKVAVAGVCAVLICASGAVWMLWLLNCVFSGVALWNMQVAK